MLPKLSTLHWALLIIFLFFYGFAVFALTRDYYLRHPPHIESQAEPLAHTVPGPGAGTKALGARMRQALDDTQGSVDLSSTDPTALGKAADQLFLQQQFAAAIPVYERVLELVPTDPETHNDLGLALHYTGRSGEAVPMLRKGTELAPTFQRGWLSLGFVALQSGDAILGRSALERAQSLDPNTGIGNEATRLLELLDRPDSSE